MTRPPSLSIGPAPPRSPQSIRLDRVVRSAPRRGGTPVAVPPYVAWPTWAGEFSRRWKVGQHVAAVGKSGSGKTTVLTSLLPIRRWVIALGTKRVDSSFYAPLYKLGFVLVPDDWDPRDLSYGTKIIFAPPLEDPTDEGIQAQRALFHKVLLNVFKTGGWTLYLDEVRYFSETLGLSRTLDLLWLQGRSLSITIVAGTQRPRSVPLNMWEMATYLMVWRIADPEDRRRTAEYAGLLAPAIEVTAPILPPHEFLVADLLTDRVVRTIRS